MKLTLRLLHFIKMIKKISIGLALVVILLVIAKWQGWIGGNNNEQVAVEKISKHTIIETVSASGKIYPVDEVKISPDVPGEVKELLVKEGDEVKAGQLLVRINPKIYQSSVERSIASLNSAKANASSADATIEQMKAQLEKAKADFDRNEKLYNDHVISVQDYMNYKSTLRNTQAQLDAAMQNKNAAKFNINSAEANMNESNENLSKTIIVSPMSGTVTQLNIEKGERVVGTSQMAGTEMMRIANLNVMEVRVDVSESDVVKIHVGDSTHIKVDAYPDKEFLGFVTDVANASKSSTTGTAEQATTFTVKIRIEPSSYKDFASAKKMKTPFWPGMNAGVEIFTNASHDVLASPIQAVTLRDDSAKNENDKITQSEVVFIVKNKTAVKRKVVTGLQDAHFIEIKSGMADGDEVIVLPASAISRRLTDKMKVEVVDKRRLQSVEGK